jgi:hypothetical protein
MIKAKSQFKRRSIANNVEITIPVPSDADSPRFRTSTGTIRYAPEKSALLWSIKSFPGGREFLLRAHFGLPSVEAGLTLLFSVTILHCSILLLNLVTCTKLFLYICSQV